MLTPKEIDFIVENAKADTTKLLLGGKKYPDINLKLCISCIESRKKLAGKLPGWHANTSLVYPFPLSAEQCSSEATGQYKRDLIATILKTKKHNGPTVTAAEATTTETTAAETTTEATAAKATTAAEAATETEATDASALSAADLTGGMGVDSYYLSGLCKRGENGEGVFHYYERNGELCEATEYNFKQLGAEHIKVHNAELSKENITQLLPTGLDFIFIDPARRSKSDKSSKVISLDEYEPNLIELQEELFKHAPIILAKVSPMADIKLNLKLLPNTTAVHIVSVDNECKELLFVIESPAQSREITSNQSNSDNNNYQSNSDNNNCQSNTFSQIPITAVNIKTSKRNDENSNGEKPAEQVQPAPGFTFTFTQEEQASVIFTTEIGEYLYEPNKSILKGGAFKILSEKYNLKKLAPSTHLYTNNQAVEDFPGKIYTVEEAIAFNKKSIKQIAAKYPKADISARNFPLDTNALKKLSGIKDGGDRHIFATTLNNGEKMILIARNRN